MKIVTLFIYVFIFWALSSCKSSDFMISSPKSSSAKSVTFDHAPFINSSCIQCHENIRPMATPIHGDGADCINCHTATLNASGVRTWKNLTNYNHVPLPASCISCHEGKRPTTLPPHLKGQWGEKQDCVTCHTYPTWKPAHFDHNKPLLTCVECHRNNSTDDRPMPKTSHPSSFYNQIDCIYCHSNSTNSSRWLDTTFNHRTHTPAPTTCLNCHEIKRPLSHTINPIIAGMDKADCKGCHVSKTDWTQVVAFDHESSKPLSCIGCHANKAPTPTTSHPSALGTYYKIDCVKCHTYDKSTSARSWAKIIFNQTTHLPNPAKCNQCHKIDNNSLPKTGVTHLSGSRANNDCSICHKVDSTNKNWKNLTPFTHAVLEVSERCDSCHNSTVYSSFLSTANVTKIAAKAANHLSTTLDCTICHTTQAWTPASFTHSSVDTNCISCHDGANASGKTKATFTGHITTTAQCSTCHSASMTATRNYDNFSKGYYTHAATDTCTTCHKNATTTSVTQVSSTVVHTTNATKACNTCHNSTSNFTTWIIHNATTTTNDTVCNTCHTGLANTYGKSTAAYTGHASIGSTQCVSCHGASLKTVPKYLNFSGGATYKHLATDTNCISCHDGTSAIGKTKATFTGHIPTTAQCNICHAASMTAARNYNNFSGGYYTHAATDTCTNCHKNTAASSATQVSSTVIHNANTTKACNTCHNNTLNYTSWAVHTNALTTNDTVCNTCHTGLANTYGKTTAAYTGHVSIGTNQCVSCHAKSLTTVPKYLSFAGGSGYTHLASNTNCKTCHNGTNATGRPTTGTKAHSLTIANFECSACHVNNSSSGWAAVYTNISYTHSSIGKLPPYNSSGHFSQSKCTLCHSTSNDNVLYKDTNSPATYATVASNTAYYSCVRCHTSTFLSKHKSSDYSSKGNCLGCHSYSTFNR